jgi:hypothetical protein
MWLVFLAGFIVDATVESVHRHTVQDDADYHRFTVVSVRVRHANKYEAIAGISITHSQGSLVLYLTDGVVAAVDSRLARAGANLMKKVSRYSQPSSVTRW